MQRIIISFSLFILPLTTNCSQPAPTTRMVYLAMMSKEDNTLAALIRDYPAVVHMVDDTYHRTPLMMAARLGKTSKMNLLCLSGSPLEAQDNMGHTALTHAASQPLIEPIRLLVEKGAEITHTLKDGSHALSIARLEYQSPNNKKKSVEFRAVADFLHTQLELQIGTIQSVLTHYTLLPALAGIVLSYTFHHQAIQEIEHTTNTALSIAQQLSGRPIAKRKQNAPLPDKQAGITRKTKKKKK